jgi:hypothetical protein
MSQEVATLVHDTALDWYAVPHSGNRSVEPRGDFDDYA